MKLKDLKDNLKKGEVFILSGGMGTEIGARGVKTTLPLWSASAVFSDPEVIKQIHLDYIKAGADIITTNTFRTTKRTFLKIGKPKDGRRATLIACKLAKDAGKESGKKVFVAGSVAPLEDCYRPELVPSNSELEKEHLEIAKDLKEGGVDFILMETMISIREAGYACQAAKKVGLEFGVSFCCNEEGNLLSGESLEQAVQALDQYGPLFILINCMQPTLITKLIKKLRKITTLPIGAYGQGDGEPDDEHGWKFNDRNAPEKYLKDATDWVKDGAQIIGGCCGTNPEYIKKLAEHFKGRELKDFN